MISVGFKHFGEESGEEVGDVVVIDHDIFDNDPEVQANTQDGEAGKVILLPSPNAPAPNGMKKLGYMTRRAAEAVAAELGVELEDH